MKVVRSDGDCNYGDCHFEYVTISVFILIFVPSPHQLFFSVPPSPPLTSLVNTLVV